MFIILSMEMKDVMDRLMTRHKDQEGMVNSLMVILVFIIEVHSAKQIENNLGTI